MNADHARSLAEALHDGQRDAAGTPLIDHIRRVAAAVPRDARVVAWLHETLEHTSISEEELLAKGLSRDELRALRLLTRDTNSRSNTRYLAHVEMIARASGAGADIARSVKRADLADRALNPPIRSDGWSPPYALGLEILQRAASRPSRPQPSEDRGVTGTDREFRAHQLGSALRGLAAELVEERRKVADLRREVAELRERLEALQKAQGSEDAEAGGAGSRPGPRDAGPPGRVTNSTSEAQ